MGLKYNGTNIYAVNYNGVSLTQINYNNVPVWYALTGCIISGTARVGKTWTATTSPSEVQSLCAYQWYRGANAIANATNRTYTTTTDDRGSQLRCLAQIGSAYAWSSYTDKILQDMSGAWISGTSKVGQQLNCYISPGEATGSYQWYRDSSAISGATQGYYTLTSSDRGHKVKCSFTGNGNFTGTVSSGYSGDVIQAVTGISFNSYTNYVGNTIYTTVNPSGATGSYQWYRDSSTIDGATNSYYTLTSDDRGHRVSCNFVANGYWEGSVSTGLSSYIYQSISGSAWISGTNEEGYTLTCNRTDWSYSCAYQWYRDSSLVATTTGNTYTLTHDDAGHKIRCNVVGTGYWSGSILTGQTEKVWGWYDWSTSASDKWSSYPSSPKDTSITIPSNVKVTKIEAVGSKAYVDGEYGTITIYGATDSSWTGLAESYAGFSEYSCTWTGSTTAYTRIIARNGFQVCSYITTKLTVSGKEKRQG